MVLPKAVTGSIILWHSILFISFGALFTDNYLANLL